LSALPLYIAMRSSIDAVRASTAFSIFIGECAERCDINLI
jgi:hypothetical protein